MIQIFKQKLTGFFSSKIKDYWQELSLAAVVLVVGFPSLFVRWMLIDDGVSIVMSEKISGMLTGLNFRGLAELFLEKEAGRFRPAYWLFQWLEHQIAGKNPFLHHLLHFFLCAITVFLIYLIIKNLTGSKTASLTGSLIYLLAPFNIENWYRLGPAEPILSFYLVLSVFFLVIALKSEKANRFYLLFSVLPLIPAYFFKETFFAILPFSMFLLLGTFLFKDGKRRKKWLKITGSYLIANLFLFMVSAPFLFLIRQPGIYSWYYHLNWEDFWARFYWYLVRVITKSFLPFSVLFLCSFSAYFFFLRKKERLTITRFFQFAFIVSFISFLFVLAPWGIPLGRYVGIALVFFVFVVGIEISYIANYRPVFLRRFPLIRNIFLTLFFLFLTITNGLTIFNYVRDIILGPLNTSKAFTFFASTATPKNSTIFWNLKKNEATIELVFEGNLHLNHIYDRKDLKIEYLDEKIMKKLPEKGFITTMVDSKQEILFPDEVFQKNKRLKLIKVIPHEVVKYILHPRSGLKILISALWPSITPAHAFLEKIENKSLWKIYEIREN